MPAEFDPLTSTLRPATDAIITLRIIKSFEYRTERNLILKDIDLTKTTVGELLDLAKKDIMTQGAFRALRNVEYDTLKLYTKAHGSKTTNLIINLDNDDWILSDHSKTLQQCGIENETEISLFNRELYEAYKSNPIEKW
ncbi:hypothetical protein V1517DRAFT_101771 [Lipomyces orientalis]|uniref:Uncharacterized protein n=1 Tax=Lipomyces orientalis TaxID=1233043 RepID=A0ACC3TXX4_9ASCO